MRSLYSKFAISTVFIMIASGIISFLISNIYYQNTLKTQNDQKMTNIALEVSAFIQSHDEMDIDNYFTHLGSIGYQAVIIDENGSKQLFGADFRKHNLPEGALDQVLAGGIYHGISAFPHKTFVTGFFANELRNTVGVPFTYHNQSYALFLRPDIKLMFNEMHIMFGWLVLGIIAFSILFVLISTKYLVKPISRLNRATALIADGDFSIKLHIHRKDEIGDLAASFNTMARKLEKVNDMRRDFISNISHDIQSPLSNIKGCMKLLNQTSLSAEHKQYIDIVDAEVSRLSNLTRQLLLLSSIESRKELIDEKRINISEQIKKVIHQYQWNLSEKGIMISYSLPEAYVKGDSSLLASVWENLLTNAIKYNQENGEIEITVKEKAEEVEVIFKDSGIGMDEAELERCAERFFRGDSSRNRAIEGTGLGLSIVQSVLDMHNGKVAAESKKGIGTTFTVLLPKG